MPFHTTTMRNGMPWGSNVLATKRYREHVQDMQTRGKKPLTPENWWNANKTQIARGG